MKENRASSPDFDLSSPLDIVALRIRRCEADTGDKLEPTRVEDLADSSSL